MLSTPAMLTDRRFSLAGSFSVMTILPPSRVTLHERQSMIHVLTAYFRQKAFKLTNSGDCYHATSPSGITRTVNLRWKTKPVWGRKAKRWEWSIPLRHWQRYLDQVDLLFVLETSTGRIFATRPKQVAPEARVYPGDQLDVGGTVFLPVTGYKQVGQVALPLER